MKYLFFIVALLTLSGCTEIHPAPEEAIKNCLDKDMIPVYNSLHSGTSFTCVSGEEYKITIGE